MKLGFGISGSFCNHKITLQVLEELVHKGYDVTCFVTDEVKNTSTRFGTKEAFMEKLEQLSQKKVISTIVDAEPYGPLNPFDAFVVAPTTAVTLSKIAHGEYNNAVTLAVKAHLRGSKPVILAIASNDLLGLSMVNLATLMNAKFFYFVPFSQDDYVKKPRSIVADFTQIEATVLEALKGNQIQPVLLGGKKAGD